MAEAGMRVVAVAYKNVNGSPARQSDIETNLVYLGIIGMYDPPRRDVSAALAATKKAGIRTIMVTGDLPLTAQKIAAAVGIDQSGKYLTGMQVAAEGPDQLRNDVKDVSIFARINSSQKLDIVHALQANGEVVAVTGDGINDAPALKSADIGIAMGEKGTEAAVEAAGMVLTDDSYKSIVTGVREGRRIYDNLSKGVLYYMSVKIGLVLCFVIPLALQVPFPFEPIQIILLELLMDLAASATFVAEPIEPDVMDRPPRDPRRRFIDRSVLVNMLLASLSLAAAVLVNYLLAYYGGKDLVEARTIAFGTWLIGHIYLAFTMRSQRQTLFKLGIFTNPVMIIWAVAAVCLLLAITGFAALHPLIRVTSLNLTGWLMILVTPFITVFWHEIKKAVANKFFATAKSA
jgi:Ca2+-transporting ATPase